MGKILPGIGSFVSPVMGLVFGLVVVLRPSLASASLGTYYMADESQGKPFHVDVQSGVRGSFHYDKNNLLATPPDLVLGELQATLWYKATWGAYLFIASTFSNAAATGPIYGGGLKYSFLNWKPRTQDNFFGWGSFQLLADLASLNFAPPVPPQDYPQSGVVFRGGMAMTWGIRLTGFFINTSLLFTYYSSNLLLQPFLGLGYFF